MKPTSTSCDKVHQLEVQHQEIISHQRLKFSKVLINGRSSLPVNSIKIAIQK
jgi:hypothetical protein